MKKTIKIRWDCWFWGPHGSISNLVNNLEQIELIQNIEHAFKRNKQLVAIPLTRMHSYKTWPRGVLHSRNSRISTWTQEDSL